MVFLTRLRFPIKLDKKIFIASFEKQALYNIVVV
jgi:hypothetical protein